MDDLKDQHTAQTIAKIYFQRHLEAPEAVDYLATRGLSAQAIKRFDVGYAPDAWRGLVDHYSSHKIRLAAKEAGLLTTPANSNRLLDFFRGRLMFPIKNESGQLVGYGGRFIQNRDNPTDPSAAKIPKYINTPETELFNKSRTLYGLYENKATIHKTRSAVLVEGYMDVIGMSQYGFNVGVAPMGTALTSEQVHLLLETGVNKLWLCLDGDSAGQNAAERSIKTIMENYHPRMEVMITTLQDQLDPDSFLRQHGPDAFRAELRAATPLPNYIHRLCSAHCASPPSIEDKAAYALNLRPYADMAAGSLQDILLKQCEAYTGLKAEDVLSTSTNGLMHSEAVTEWHPLVAIAARIIAHTDPELTPGFIEQIQQFEIDGHGYPQLQQLVHDIGESERPSSLMYRYATTMGEPGHEEIAYFAGEWRDWLKNEALREGLDRVADMPFDASAKQEVKSYMRMG